MFTANDNSKLVLSALEKAVLRALVRIGSQAEGYAKDLCPVGTPESTGVPGYVGGLLRNSITFAISGEKPKISSYRSDDGKRNGTYSGTAPTEKDPAVYIGTNVEYAAYVELGTGKYYQGGRQESWTYQDDNGNRHMTNGHRAQPYLKPAATDHKQTYRNILEDELKNA